MINMPNPSVDDVLSYCRGILGAAGITLNILVLIAITKYHKKLNSHLVLVINLCVSDLLLACVGIVKFIIWQCIIHVDLDSLPTYIWEKVTLIPRIVTPISVLCTTLTLIIMTFDHYLAIFKPLRYRSLFPKRRAIVGVVICWLIPILYYVSLRITVTVVNLNANRTSDDTVGYLEINPYAKLRYTISILAVLTFIFMAITYIRILYAVKRLAGNPLEGNTNTRSNRKATITTIWVLATFLLAWLPYSIMFLTYQSAGPDVVDFIHRHFDMVRIIDIAPYINIVCDPVIYAIRLEKIRANLRDMCCRRASTPNNTPLRRINRQI